MWQKDQGYQDVQLFKILEDLSVFLPPADVLVECHDWAVKMLTESPILVLRGDYHAISEPGREFSGCARVYPLSASRRVVTTDNEFTASLYEIFRSWRALRLGTPSLRTLFSQHNLATGTIKPMPDSAERETLRAQLNELLGTTPKMAQVSGLRSQQELKYSHLLGLKEPDLQPPPLDLEDELKARFYRILSPLNVFPTPKKARDGNGYRHVANVPLHQNDIGETFQLAMAAVVRRHLLTHPDGKRVWEEYCQHGRAPREFRDSLQLARSLDEAREIVVSTLPEGVSAAGAGPQVPQAKNNVRRLPTTREMTSDQYPELRALTELEERVQTEIKSQGATPLKPVLMNFQGQNFVCYKVAYWKLTMNAFEMLTDHQAGLVIWVTDSGSRWEPGDGFLVVSPGDHDEMAEIKRLSELESFQNDKENTNSKNFPGRLRSKFQPKARIRTG